jgi:hypothetical protein
LGDILLVSEDCSQQVITDCLGMAFCASLQCLHQLVMAEHLLERVGGLAGAVAKQQEYIAWKQLDPPSRWLLGENHQ